MSDFGDDHPLDAYSDEGEPEPDAVAERLHDIESALRTIAGLPPLPDWNSDPRRAAETSAMQLSLVSLTPATADTWAEPLHNARRTVEIPELPPWDELTVEEKNIATLIARQITGWLRAEGTLQ